jgi:hypothetical protein
MRKSLIKELLYKADGSKTESIYEKTKLFQVDGITLSKEVKKTAFDNNDVDLIRVKNRVSVYDDNFPNYRIDITYSYEFNELMSVKNNKTKLLPTVKTLEDFVNSAFHTNVKYEVEFERITRVNPDNIPNEVAQIKAFVSNKQITKLEEVAKLLNKEGGNFKSIAPRPLELNKNMFAKSLQPVINDFLVTEKTDGKRAFIYCDGTSYYEILMNEENKLGSWTDKFILDCEKFEGKYYVFDNLLSKDKFENRYNELKTMKFPPNIVVKEMFDFDRKICDKLMKKPNIDGLIFTSKSEEIIYKWKPIEHITLEFMLKLNDGIYDLYCGISRQMAQDLHLTFYGDGHYGYTKFYSPDNLNASTFTPTNENEEDLDGKICEMWFNKSWSLVKVRTEYQPGDYYGNDFRVCQLIFINYNNPLLYSDLFDPPDQYFNKVNDSVEMSKYNLRVKHSIYNKIPLGNKRVCELSCGQGADMFHLAKIGYEYGLFVDVDKSAISSLLDRYYNYQKSRQSVHNLKINTLVTDLLEPADITMEKIRAITSVQHSDEFKFNLVSMQFAIHYFMEDFNNLCKLVARLTDDGYFFFTCFNGYKLDFVNDEIKLGKHHIIKLNKKKIKVKLPFSDSYYEEYMVFDVETELKNYGFELVESASFVDPKVPTGLDKFDEKFSSLYYYYIFKRNGKGFDVPLDSLVAFNDNETLKL